MPIVFMALDCGAVERRRAVLLAGVWLLPSHAKPKLVLNHQPVGPIIWRTVKPIDMRITFRASDSFDLILFFDIGNPHPCECRITQILHRVFRDGQEKKKPLDLFPPEKSDQEAKALERA